MDREIEYALRTARERGVTFVRLWCVDVLGTIKGLAFPISELEAVIERGVEFDGSALEGGARLAEHDAIARPEASGFQVLPWREQAAVARMFARIETAEGNPFDGDSRAVLRRVVEQAAARNLSPQVGAEVEFYLFTELPQEGRPEPVGNGGYYDLTPLDIATDFRRSSIRFLEQLGVPVRSAYHEAGPGQQEVVLPPADPVGTADAILTTRMAMKQAAYNHGHYASFMPKPLAGVPGSGLHLSLSLFDAADCNLFAGDADGAPLSEAGMSFMAGVLHHAPEITAVLCQWVNSYTRLADGHEAPRHANWSRQHANPMVRIPAGRASESDLAHIEVRLADAGTNPYLAMALLIAAGLRGMDAPYPCPSEVLEGGTGGGLELPQTLRQAVDLFEQSTLVRETLGDRVTDWIVANKRRDIDEFARQVTDFELRQSLPSL